MEYPANELWGNSSPVCPYCKAKQEIECDFYDNKTEQLPCQECGKTFTIYAFHNIEYCTKGDCEINGDLPHELVTIFQHKETVQYRCRKCHGEVYNWQLPGGRHPRLVKGEFEIIEDQDWEFL